MNIKYKISTPRFSYIDLIIIGIVIALINEHHYILAIITLLAGSALSVTLETNWGNPYKK